MDYGELASLLSLSWFLAVVR